MDRQRVGALIKKKRKEKKMHQKQLADQLHVTDTTISKWENGVNFPDIQNLKALSSILDIPMFELLGNECGSSYSEPLQGDEHSGENDVSSENTETTLSRHDAPSIETSHDILEEEFAFKAESPDAEEADGNLPERKLADADHHFWKKLKGLIVATLLLGILSLGAMMVANRVQTTADAPFSFKIVDEYYGDCDGEQAYYLIVEYTGEPINEDIKNHSDSVRITHAGCFKECAMIVIYYINNRILYEGEYIENSADYEVTLYPLPLQ